MKELIFLFGVLSTILCVGTVFSSPVGNSKPRECGTGPSYWCQNITTASSCKAVKHCIQTVWEHKKVPHDTDSVCQICKNMVIEARDQLQSNETQEELKEVFDGSCKLIPLKVISKECCKLADDFIPDLVETLSSQMNPDVVCSVAGLCNNARIDKLLAEAKARDTKLGVDLTDDTKVNGLRTLDCDGCYSVAGKMESNFEKLNRDEVLEGMVRVCGKAGSYSDLCSNVVLSYFNEIYDTLKRDFKSENICHISGVCSEKFHQHATAVEIISHGSVGVRAIEGDDLPCDLCSQLVGHLRDLLVANTTEDEFKKVLEGLCSQTKTFAKECSNIVDSYYGTIYEFLVKELDPKEICVMASLCPAPNKYDIDTPAMPLLSIDNLKKSELIGNDESNSYKSNLEMQFNPPLEFPESFAKVKSDQVNRETLKPESTEHLNAAEIQNAQLPIDRIMPQSLLGAHSSESCAFCEYILHFIQVEISDSKNEAEIKEVVESICHKLPSTVGTECATFVETYGDAFIALLAEEIDPSLICPMLSICPKANQDVEVLMESSYNDKPNCPLCLFAVQQLEELVKDKKTEESISKALDELCIHLPKDLTEECTDFVQTYTNELIEMLVADLVPQEVCEYLKICSPKPTVWKLDIEGNQLPQQTSFNDLLNGGDILTNEIPDITVGGQIHMPQNQEGGIQGGPFCVLCKTVAEQVLKTLNGSIEPEDIKKALHKTCNSCPEKEKCNEFVSKYFDRLVDIIADHTDPTDICMIMFLCMNDAVEVQESVTECIICEEAVQVLHMLLKNPNVDHDIEHLMKKACSVFPNKNVRKCEMFMLVYGKTIIEMLQHETNNKAVCKKINLCSGDAAKLHMVESTTKKLLGAKECTWGPSYWCTDINTATKCNAVEHCQKKYWGNKP